MSGSNLWPIEDSPPKRVRRIGRRFTISLLGDIALPAGCGGLRLSTQLIRLMSLPALDCLLAANPIVIDRDGNLIAGLRSYRVVVEYYSDRAANPLDVKVPVVVADREMSVRSPHAADVLSELLYAPRDIESLARGLMEVRETILWREPLTRQLVASLLGISARRVPSV